MKRRVIIPLFAMAIILVAIVLLINRKGSFGRHNTSFAVSREIDISRIQMSQGDQSLVLRKVKEGWTVNDAGEARKSAVSFLVQILREFSIKSPVTDSHFDVETARLGSSPVKVRVLAGRRVVASFIVYKTDSNIYGNIMKRSDRSKPFIVAIPGFEGDIGSAFNLNELYWLPFHIFNALPSEICSVSVKYRVNPNDSFTVVNPSCSDFPDSDTEIDSLKVRRYLSYFTYVPFEKWAFELDKHQTDSIISAEPELIITVEKRDGRSSTLYLWKRIKAEGDNKVSDTDRLWGRVDDSGALFIARYFDLDPILRKKSYFYPVE